MQRGLFLFIIFILFFGVIQPLRRVVFAASVDPLSSCTLTQPKAKQTLSQILESLKGIQALELKDQTTQNSCKTDNKSSSPVTSVLQAQVMNQTKVKSEEHFDFGIELWRESMKSLLLNRIDAELRFSVLGTKQKSVPELLQELCSSNQDGFDYCQGSELSKNEKADLIKFGEQAAKLYHATPKLSPAEMARGLALRAEASHAFFKAQQVEYDRDHDGNHQGFARSSTVIKKPLITVSDKKIMSQREADAGKAAELAYLQQNLNPNTEIGKKNLKLYTAVAPLLLTPSISSVFNSLPYKFKQNSSFEISASEAQKALGEYKNAIGTVTYFMGRNLSNATHPNAFADERVQLAGIKAKQNNPAFIYEMMATHPAAIAQILVKHPERRAVICSLLKMANQSQMLSAAEEKVLESAMFATAVVSGGLMLPEVLGMGLSAGTSASLSSLAVVNGAVAQTLFIGNIVQHGSKEFQLAQELSQLRTEYTAQTGIREDDVRVKKAELDQNRVNLAWDAFYVAASHLPTSVELPDSVQKAIEKLSASFKIKPEQIKAGATLLMHSCALLDNRCGAFMAIFHGKSKAEQEEILRDPKKIKKLNEDFIGQKEQNKSPHENVANSEKSPSSVLLSDAPARVKKSYNLENLKTNEAKVDLNFGNETKTIKTEQIQGGSVTDLGKLVNKLQKKGIEVLLTDEKLPHGYSGGFIGEKIVTDTYGNKVVKKVILINKQGNATESALHETLQHEILHGLKKIRAETQINDGKYKAKNLDGSLKSDESTPLGFDYVNPLTGKKEYIEMSGYENFLKQEELQTYSKGLVGLLKNDSRKTAELISTNGKDLKLNPESIIDTEKFKNRFQDLFMVNQTQLNAIEKIKSAHVNGSLEIVPSLSTHSISVKTGSLELELPLSSQAEAKLQRLNAEIKQLESQNKKTFNIFDESQPKKTENVDLKAKIEAKKSEYQKTIDGYVKVQVELVDKQNQLYSDQIQEVAQAYRREKKVNTNGSVDHYFTATEYTDFKNSLLKLGTLSNANFNNKLNSKPSNK